MMPLSRPRGEAGSLHRLRCHAVGGAHRRDGMRRRLRRQPCAPRRHVDQQRAPRHRRRDTWRPSRRDEKDSGATSQAVLDVVEAIRTGMSGRQPHW